VENISAPTLVVHAKDDHLDRAVAREIDEMFARNRGVQSGVITEVEIARLPSPSK
jgi:hypothetical protein